MGVFGEITENLHRSDEWIDDMDRYRKQQDKKKKINMALYKAGRVRKRLVNKVDRNKKTLDPKVKNIVRVKIKDLNSEIRKGHNIINPDILNKKTDDAESLIPLE